MVLSKREKYIACSALAVVAILLLDSFLLTPLQRWKDKTQEEQQKLAVEVERGLMLLNRRRQLSDEWRNMVDTVLPAGQAEAESKVLHALRNWSQQSGLTLASLRPERSTERGKLNEITFQAAATGNMQSVARFLWSIESSQMPVRVTDLQLNARREGTDDLALQLRISVLCRPQDQTARVTHATTIEMKPDTQIIEDDEDE